MKLFLKSVLHKLLKTMQGDLTIKLYTEKGGRKQNKVYIQKTL